MFYEHRQIKIAKADSAAALAGKLMNTWTLCTAFKLDAEGTTGLMFINDATCEDGANEWAVTTVPCPHLDGDVIQFESITAGRSEERNLEMIELCIDIVQGNAPRPFQRTVKYNEHAGDYCPLCR